MDSFSDPAHRYNRLELGCGAALGLDKVATQGPLRARWKRFGTLGLPEGRPGKGAKRLYSPEQCLQLLVALLLNDAGLDPTIIVPAIKHCWPHMREKVKQAASEAALGNPIMLLARLQQTKPLITGNPRDALPWISVFEWTDVVAKVQQAKHGLPNVSDNVLMLLSRDEPGGIYLCNLTRAAFTLQTVLDEKRSTVAAVTMRPVLREKAPA